MEVLISRKLLFSVAMLVMLTTGSQLQAQSSDIHEQVESLLGVLGGLQGTRVERLPPYRENRDVGVAYDAKEARENRERVARATDNLLKMRLAIKKFNEANGQLPTSEAQDAKLSWRVQILPYLNQEKLHKKFKLDEAWDSDSNKKLLAEMPTTFVDPRLPETKEKGMTYYQAFKGKGTPMGDKAPFKPKGLFDPAKGGKNFLLVEAGEAIPWTRPDVLVLEEGKPLPKLGKPKEGFLALALDGQVRGLPSDFDDKMLRLALRIDHEEWIQFPEPKD